MYKSYTWHLKNMGSLFLVGPLSTEPEQDSCSFQLCCTLIYSTVPSSTRADTVLANATTKKVIQKHFQNVMLVGMASEISKNYSYKIQKH